MPEHESQRFDKIIKENLEQFILHFAATYLGLELQDSAPLDPKLQTTIEREPDVLRLVRPKDAENYILQIEFQSYDQKDMVYRMAEYKAILQRKYKISVVQYVIYLGIGKSKMPTSLPANQQIKDFQLLQFSEFKYTDFLNAEAPETIILAILCDFLGHDPEFVVAQILERLQNSLTTPEELRKYLIQLNVLAQLPKLDQLIDQKVITMPIHIDIRENAMVKRILREDKESTLENVIERMIIANKLSLEDIATYTDTSFEIVKAIKARLDKSGAAE